MPFNLANPMSPEEKARQQIDATLIASGWGVQTKDKIKLSAARGVAIVAPTRTVAEVERRLSVVEELAAVVSANLERGSWTDCSLPQIDSKWQSHWPSPRAKIGRRRTKSHP